MESRIAAENVSVFFREPDELITGRGGFPNECVRNIENIIQRLFFTYEYFILRSRRNMICNRTCWSIILRS